VVHKYHYITQYSVEFLFMCFSGWMSVWVNVIQECSLLSNLLMPGGRSMWYLQLHNLDVYQKVYNGKKIFTSYKNYLGPLWMSILSWVLPSLTWGYLFFSHKFILHEISYLKESTAFSLDTKAERY